MTHIQEGALMKPWSHALLFVLLSGLFAASASATIVTVNLTAHITGVSDQNGVFYGQIATGQPVTATYTYDTNTVNQNPPPQDVGQYQPATPPANITVTVGAFSFQSNSTPSQSMGSSQFQINVQPASSGGLSFFAINSSSDQAINPPGAAVATINLTIADATGQWPSSIALPTNAPTQNFSTAALPSQLQIQGAAQNNFTLTAWIDSAVLAPPAVQVSPASGSFLAQQHFEAALLLTPGAAQIVSVQSSAGFSYPGTCQLAPPNSSQQPAILCPHADAVLATLGGGTSTILWQVVLADGTQLNQTVTWTLIQ
jgi:hypothetical protein